MVILKKFSSSEINELSQIQARLVYDSTSNVLKFNNSQTYNNILVSKDTSNNITNINQLSTTGLLSTIIANNNASNTNYQTWTNDLATDMITALQMNNVGVDFGTTSSHPLALITAGTERLSIDTSGNIDLLNHNGSTIGLKLGGTLVTATATELNYVDTTTGTAEASKALIVDANRDISNIRNLTCTSLTVNGESITGSGTPTELTGITPGTAAASKALVLDTSRNITNINQLSTTGLLSTIIANNNASNTNYQTWTNDLATDMITALQMNNVGVDFGTTSSHPLALITAGTERLSIDTSGNIDLLNHNGSTIGLKLGGTLVTATATELNYVDTTAGTAEASKALIVDVNRDISNIRNLTCSGDLTLNGASSTLSISGSSATLSISGASAKLTISNTTSSTSSSTGALQVSGGAYFGAASLFAGNVTMNGSLNVGTVGTSDNRINFSGLTGDAGTNHTVIAERIYEASSEKSELLLFKGNDPATLTGPDRIRMRASEFRFQTYTTAEDYSGMSDNNNRLIISNSGDISISSTTASTSSSTGALQVAGGAYFGAASLFAGNLTNNASIIAGNSALSAASWTTSGIQFRTSATTYTNTTAGTAASAVFNSFARPTLAASSALTTTNAATVYIDNSPAVGTNMTITNAYALWVNSGNSLFGGALGVTGAVTLSNTLGVTGVATLSSNLTLNGSSATLSISGASAKLTISNTTASTSSSTGALQVAGGAYFGASSLFGSNVTINDSLNITKSGGGSGFPITFQTWTNTNPTPDVIVRLELATDIVDFNVLTAYPLRFKTSDTERLTIRSTGEILISVITASTSSSTGALQVSGGIYVGANSLFSGNITFNGTSSNISLTGASSYISLTGASSFIRITTNTTASTSSSTGALQVAGGAYFGAASLFAGNLTNNATIIAGNAALSAASWTTSGIQFRTSATTYTNTTAGAAASAVFNSFARPTLAASSALTTTNAATVYIDNSPAAGANQTITNAYSLWVNSGNSLFGSTLRVIGQSTPASGEGIELAYGNNIANFYSYDRTGNSYKNINLNDKMYIKSDGTVGIGTNSPSYPLHITTTATSYTGSFAFYAYTGSATTTGVSTNNTDTSIYASSRVVASEFNAFSDSRIKKNILDVNDLSALNTLRLIQPKKYNYIDTRNKTNEPVWGFIAQQVRSVLEHSTILIKDFIPNIFQLATKSVNENNECILTVPNLITFDSNGTGKMKLISENEKTVFVTIKNKLSTTQILINEYLEENNYFIYGEEVDNFHSLNKDAIFTITTAAVQEIDRKQINQESKIEILENKINELQQKNINLETRLAILESLIN
jgi:uncharacterized protein YbcV (DUF1398 family)